MSTKIVKVWDTPCEVTTHRKSKSVWIASGTYMGESHSTQGQSEGAAVIRWREWATYKGG
jgi:hypothetical protein